MGVVVAVDGGDRCAAVGAVVGSVAGGDISVTDGATVVIAAEFCCCC